MSLCCFHPTIDCKEAIVQMVPSDPLSLTNRVIVNSREYPKEKYPEVNFSVICGTLSIGAWLTYLSTLEGVTENVEITTSENQKFVFTVEPSDQMNEGCMGFNLPMRKWAQLSINDKVHVRFYKFNPNTQYVSKMTLFIAFMKQSTIEVEFDTDLMAKEFLLQFPLQAFTIGQILCFKFSDKNLLRLTVKELQIFDTNNTEKCKEPEKTRIGLTIPKTKVIFEKGSDPNIILIGQSKP